MPTRHDGSPQGVRHQARAPGMSGSTSFPAPDPEHQESITRSHQRCEALGLRRLERPDLAPVSRPELALARERNHRLLQHAAPVMEQLLEQILATRSIVVLSDAHGTVLHSVGPSDFLERAAQVALAPGADWSEQHKGTNAVGTALITEAPSVVHGGEHYLQANGFLTCSAAPIFDPRGELLGVLDVSGDCSSYHPHTLGLVKMSVRMIENRWLREDHRKVLRLHFHARAEYIDTLMEGILAIDRDGRVLGANRSALEQLGVSGAALRMNTLVGLFGIPVDALVDHFRSPVAAPLCLCGSNGQQVYVRARFNWTGWARLQGDTPANDGPVDVVSQVPAIAAAPGSAMPAAAHPTGPADETREPAAALEALHSGDAQMASVVGKIRRVLDRGIPVLILGETGTGKELLARAIHQDSSRARRPFIAVNCASLPEALIEAELFGYEEGAFTGARRKGAPGKIVQAHGGTLFLDEIGDMPLALQARLLRVLQERQVTPLGSTRSVEVDVAVISATHCRLQEMIQRQAFREDLYYRLNGLAVRLPALRERTDLMRLVEKILRSESKGRVPQLDAEVTRLVLRYRWPGNIRQLCNVLRTAAVMAAGEALITRAHLPDDFLDDAQRGAVEAPWAPQAPTEEECGAAGTLEELELQAIRRGIEEAGGNISVASRRLGISRNTIYRKLRWRQTETS
ncbi:sigma-54-dependent Fis family transcriptional regulator [Aquabacterium sp. A7-Y]|uniref:sigma-54-dependent Fis family transcriptional regulator n=1 Tax=Aquabacterium sp. A7-Y TaxID=1349605 RepID=UPI00223E25E8|nr:sigma-54-dependent Fis family transcriptional regulator [Aquabacterium sp. A7-Y]MCW7538667.1 sigma-54-dependent Fis family transcriptional regulator [Aquabacterium sp. A7-Y]